MSDKMKQILTDLWNDYKNNGESVVFNPYAVFIEQMIFKKLDNTGNIDKLERMFLIDYMKAGIMNDAEILDYEDLRRKNPSAELPEVDF